MTTPAAQDKPSARRTTVIAPKEDDDPRPTNEETADTSLTFVPVLLNGQKHSALLDSGADRSLISKSLVDELGATVEPKEGSIKLTDDQHDPAHRSHVTDTHADGIARHPLSLRGHPEACRHAPLHRERLDQPSRRARLPRRKVHAAKHNGRRPSSRGGRTNPAGPVRRQQGGGVPRVPGFPRDSCASYCARACNKRDDSTHLPTVEFGGGECQRQSRCQQQTRQRTEGGSASDNATAQHRPANAPVQRHVTVCNTATERQRRRQQPTRTRSQPSRHRQRTNARTSFFTTRCLRPPRTIASPTTATPRSTTPGSLRPTLTTKRPSPATGVAEARLAAPHLPSGGE